MIKYFVACTAYIFLSVALFAQSKNPKKTNEVTIAPIQNVPNKIINNILLPVKINGTITLATPAGTTAQANGIKCGSIVVTVDTSIRVAPAYAYLSVDFTGITGSMQIEILAGNNIFGYMIKQEKK